MAESILYLALAILVIYLIVTHIRIVPQTQTYVIERFGKFHKRWEAGIHLKIPFIDRIAAKVSLKEQVLDFPPQPVITKDNVTMQIDSVVFCKVIDPKLYVYGVE
ncbi:MAG: SPFH/Band 7/PHB domain protein, partial [Clostridia bacterium]|nr:SPFH/Band 7/PHB domain protein [Clostridia bacterium]